MNDPEAVDRPALQRLQTDRLRPLLAEVAAHNAFYRQKWQDAGVRDPSAVTSLEELSGLPLTTKQELVSDQAEHPPFGTVLTYPLQR
ncbi:MAG: phenylacetate--CoA ligase family protein, partial [bacterium]